MKHVRILLRNLTEFHRKFIYEIFTKTITTSLRSILQNIFIRLLVIFKIYDAFLLYASLIPEMPFYLPVNYFR